MLFRKPNLIQFLLGGGCCSVAQSCPSLSNPMDGSTPGFPVLHISQSSLKLISIESLRPFDYLILCHPLLLLPSIFPSIRVFSNESVLHIRWPQYWSLSFSINPSNEYSGLISSRVVSSAYVRLLILLPAILIRACESSSPVFHVVYST